VPFSIVGFIDFVCPIMYFATNQSMYRALTILIISVLLGSSAVSQERQEARSRRTTDQKPVIRTRVQDERGSEGRQTKSEQKPRKEKVRSKSPSGLESDGESEEVHRSRLDTKTVKGNDLHSESQDATGGDRIPSGENHRKLFDKVQDGLSSGRVSSFSDLLGPQVHVTLRGGESGYYSSSQAYYLLEKYLHTNRLSDLEFSTIGESGNTPYASGKGGIIGKGGSERAQVYVSLTQVGERWLISQIKIY
jgi:hypothetical protein